MVVLTKQNPVSSLETGFCFVESEGLTPSDLLRLFHPKNAVRNAEWSFWVQVPVGINREMSGGVAFFVP